MPISLDGTRALLAGRCTAEEADALHEWLRATRDAVADLSGCDEVHTALVQLLLAARLPVHPPADPILASCLAAAGLPGAAPPELVPAIARPVPQAGPAARRRNRPARGKNKKVS